MSSLGELYFSLGLDSQKFDDAIKEAKKRVAELTGEASITINADASNVAAQVQDDLNKITGKKAEIKLGVDKSSKASVEELINDIAEAEKKLEHLKNKESWNTSAIERQEGFISSLKKQLEEAKAVKVAATEAKEAINDMVQSSQSVQHVINEEDINLVRELKEELVGVNRQFEVRNRLEQGKIDAAEKNKAERQALEEEKALNDFISNARKKRAAAAKEEAQAELEAAKKKESAAKESNKALESQLAQMFRLEEAIKKLQNLQVKLNTSGINTNTMEFKEASSALDEYIQKLQKMQGSGLSLNKREVSAALGVDMTSVMNRTNSFISEQIKLEKKAASESARASKEKERQVKLVDRIKNGLKNSSDWASQLNNQITNAFSIYSIERFIRNLYTIGGEFQKQQIALQAMIGDADKGNAIFERAKGLAVISPFTFSELSSYTKQMSAYGIEYEELYDTTKRLADISAGVGVDMGRLILAFGQVRSAAVLRGQELRQFTEAGIPLVAELAKRFTELEGKAVSTGEVFDKISKRQVSFGMVKDILFDMTDPGGRFFKMQEEQAKSLAGQWSNLKDAWDIMVADIANASSGALGMLSSTIKGILDTWRAWSPVLLGIVGLIGTYSAAIRIAELATSALNLVTNANPWVKVISVVVSATSAIIGYQIATKDATKTIEDLNVEFEKSKATAEDNERTANRYLDILSKSTDKEDEKLQLQRKQQIALEELTRMYEPLFKNMNLESMTLDVIARKRAEINEMTKKNTLESFRDNRAQMISMKLSMERELATMEKTNKSNKNPLIDSDFFKSLGGKFNDWFGTSDEDIAKKKQDILEITQAISDLDDEIKTTAEAESWEELKKKLSLSSTVDEYVAVYGEIGKAVKILREKGVTDPIIDPKMGTSVIEYNEELNKLLKEQKGIMDDFNPNTDTHKNAANLAKIYESAIKAIGGVPFSKKTSGKSEAEKAAEKEGERIAKAYYESVKRGLSEVASKWDLYKQLFEATGNKDFAMTAFKVTPVWDEAAKEMADKFKQAALVEDVDWNMNDTEAKEKFGELYDSWKLIKDRIEKNGIDLKVNIADIYKSSKDFDLRIDTINRELHDKLQKLSTSGLSQDVIGALSQDLTEQAEQAISEVEFEKFKKSVDYVRFFSNLENQGVNSILAMRDAMLKFGSSTELSTEEMDALVEDVERLEKSLVDKHPFKAIELSVGNIKALRDAYNSASSAYKKNPTTDNLRKKEQAKSELDAEIQNISSAFKRVYDRFSEFANAVGEISSMLEKFGNRSLTNFANFLDSASSGMQSGYNVGSLFGAKGGVIGGFIGAATGAMAGLVEAGRKAVDAEQERSQIVIDRLDKVASLLKDRIAESLTGLYNSTLDATSKMEMLRKQTEYNEAAKKVQSQNGTIDPNSWYGMTFDKTTFPWDTNDYLVYSKKTHDAINRALEMDNEFMATYASMLAQRDELMYQQATYTDKDSDKVDAYKRDKAIEIQNLNAEIEKLTKDMLSSLYNVDFKDWASQLADSIVNAWANGEDAAKAYEATVSDILRNVATSMIQQKILGDYFANTIDPWVKDFIAGGGVMTDELYYRLAGIVDGGMERIDQAEDALDAWEKALNERGLSLKDNKEDSSSGGLSKGIQSITEETANLLGSYLNSIRHDSSIQRTLIEQLVSVDVPQMSIIAQAQLQQLQQVVANTKRNADAADSIREALSSVIGIGKNGKAIKIV